MYVTTPSVNQVLHPFWKMIFYLPLILRKLMPLQTILPLYLLKITKLYQSLIIDAMIVSTILHVTSLQ